MTLPISDKKRIAWACRRGMLELDIVLISFLEKHFDALTLQDKHLFVSLLTSSDQDLFDWFLQKKSPPEEYASLITHIMACRGLVG